MVVVKNTPMKAGYCLRTVIDYVGGGGEEHLRTGWRMQNRGRNKRWAAIIGETMGSYAIRAAAFVSECAMLKMP